MFSFSQSLLLFCLFLFWSVFYHTKNANLGTTIELERLAIRHLLMVLSSFSRCWCFPRKIHRQPIHTWLAIILAHSIPVSAVLNDSFTAQWNFRCIYFIFLFCFCYLWLFLVLHTRKYFSDSCYCNIFPIYLP